MSPLILGPVLVYLWAGAWQDLRTWRVSNKLTLPALGLAWGYRLLVPSVWVPVVAVFCLLCWGWTRGWLGGADVKGLLTLALLENTLLIAAILGLYLWYGGTWLATRTRPTQLPGFAGFALGVSLWSLLHWQEVIPML